MTREEAIKILKSKMDGHTDTSYDWAETVRMAIKALEQQSDDCVSRQAVLDKAWDVPYEGTYIQVVDVGDIQELPPVTPTRKVGKQITIDNTHSQCSECGVTFCITSSSEWEVSYCPNCGAEMRGAEHGSN